MKNLLLLPLFLILFGCASATHNAMQRLKVETITAEGQEMAGAECALTNNAGTWLVRSGAEVQVHRSAQDLSVACSSNGLPDAKGSVVSRANVGMAGNVILGGAIGVLVDHNGGSGYTYPSWIKLVFGQSRIYDRKNETEGFALSGTLPPSPPPSGETAQVAPIEPNVAKRITPATDATKPAVPVSKRPARLQDAESIPYLGSNGRNAYREWIGKSSPKAFAIAANGWYEWTQGSKGLDPKLPSDPAQRALQICERGAKQPCTLYAVDDAIVWTDTATATP